ncbi:MAG: TorF family putative porin [Bordetella sp.]|nr:TorF family putative porin [Bordetella sp.]
MKPARNIPRLLSAAALSAALAAFTAPAVHAAADADGSLTANLSVASQYRYRGLMQTNNKPALQGGFDYSHPSGFYAGNWNSTISWLGDGNDAVSAPLEMDFYGGYKGKLGETLDLDVGVLQYYYPGDYPSGYTRPHTTELYAGLGAGPVTFKVSHSLTNLFGFARSRNSQYYDLSGNFDTGVWGLTLNLHAGYQYVRNVDHASYWDWKAGLTKDFGAGWSASLAYIDTNADRRAYTNADGRDMGRGTALASLTRTF